ncbi:cystathionine beta-lyase [Purpureocillium lilacinum]|uniref:Cystathionine beta-lyase n=2 Tax=Purpureocillium lilacinum TaxID=33203 RepID=A0A2U3E853_PURLI|nr:cystathionine beta-lyase [Purpureocillium lilacinum]
MAPAHVLPLERTFHLVQGACEPGAGAAPAIATPLGSALAPPLRARAPTRCRRPLIGMQSVDFGRCPPHRITAPVLSRTFPDHAASSLLCIDPINTPRVRIPASSSNPDAARYRQSVLPSSSGTMVSPPLPPGSNSAAAAAATTSASSASPSPSSSSAASASAGKMGGTSANPLKRVDLDGHDLPPSPAPSSPRNGRRRYALATELVYTEGKDQYGASSIPIYQSATFKQTSANGGQQEFDYTRSGNPTRTHLERHLAKIMNANRALAVSSGMGALDVITRLLRPGDEVITGDDLYGGTHRLLTYMATNQGIIVHHVDTTNPESVASRISEKTAMVLLETPTNPLIKIVDLSSIARMAHDANSKALVVVDNTMLSPMLCNPLDLGADIVYESGTKYLSGHHDIMAGVIACNDASVGDKLFFTINSTGCGLSPNDSFLLMRGVKTLAIRMEKQQANAQAIAEFLESRGFRVRYPGLKSHPQYDLHWSIARGAGAVLSFETGDATVSQRIVEAARLWAISVSFGCVNSLISMPCQMSHASIDAKTRRERQMPEDIIRLCVGIEDANDLIEDLSRALVQAGAVTVTLDGFHATGAAEELGKTPLTVD